MLQRLLILTMFLPYGFGATCQIKKTALFLGNSYTSANNLPQMIAQMAASTGDTLLFDSFTPGGYTLQGHASNPTAIAKISAAQWDYVVLQEQSQRPSFSGNFVETAVFPFAKKLDSIIQHAQPCGETVFYSTWGRKNGDAENCVVFPTVCTYSGMDSLLHVRYLQMAEQNDAIVSPVGAVWKYIRNNFPAIELYQSDGSHPSLAGTYAAACTFYASLFRKDPSQITVDAGLPSSVAQQIRLATKTVVFDGFSNWFIGTYDPASNFSFTKIAYDSILFTNLSQQSSEYYWDFGDGNFSMEANPIHHFISEGNYLVGLRASQCEKVATYYTYVEIKATDLSLTEEAIFIYPNPFVEETRINITGIERLVLVNVAGQTCTTDFIQTGNHVKIRMAGLPAGVYFLLIQKKGKSIRKKIIKAGY